MAFGHRNTKVVNGEERVDHTSRKCWHCSNTGHVVIVMDGDDAAVPCPMCRIGQTINEDRPFWGISRPDGGTVRAADYVWNGFMTENHTVRCRYVHKGLDSSDHRCDAIMTPDFANAAKKSGWTKTYCLGCMQWMVREAKKMAGQQQVAF